MSVASGDNAKQGPLFVKHGATTVPAKHIGLEVQEIALVVQEFAECPTPQVLSDWVAKNINKIAGIRCWCGKVPINCTGSFRETVKLDDRQICVYIFCDNTSFAGK